MIIFLVHQNKNNMKTRLKMLLPIGACAILIAVIWHTPKEEENMTVVREHIKMPKVNVRTVVVSSTNKFLVKVKPCQE